MRHPGPGRADARELQASGDRNQVSSSQPSPVRCMPVVGDLARPFPQAESLCWVRARSELGPSSCLPKTPPCAVLAPSALPHWPSCCGPVNLCGVPGCLLPLQLEPDHILSYRGLSHDFGRASDTCSLSYRTLALLPDPCLF